jgi:hypothetical protein
VSFTADTTEIQYRVLYNEEELKLEKSAEDGRYESRNAL